MKYLTEFQLVWLCGLSIALCLISSISMGITWTYWTPALNSCSRMNCGCILYGTSYVTIFVGGDITFCQLVTFCPLIPAVIVFGICAYHAFKLRKSKSMGVRMPSYDRHSDIQFVARNRSSEQQYSCSFILLAFIVFLLLFIEACFILEGYKWTCKEYKNHVLRYLNATGDLSTIVNDRLPCGVMYDFLDYLQPDILIRQPGIRSIYHHRSGHINTAAILQTCLVSSWANVIIWSMIVIFIGFCKYRSK